MDRYSRVAPARPVCLSSLRPAAPCAASGRRSGGAEIGIFTAERYFSAADVVKRHDTALLRPAPPDQQPPPPPARMSGYAASDDVASCQSGRTAASSAASWNSRSELLSGAGQSAAAVNRIKGRGDRYNGGNNKKKPSNGRQQRWRLFGRDCPCAGRKAVTVDAASSSEPRSSPAMDARFSAQSAVEECLESAIFKAKTTMSPPKLPVPPPVSEEEPPAKVKVTVTPGSRAFPLVASAPNRAVPSEAFAAAIGRRAGGGFALPAALGAARLSSVLDDDDEPPRPSLDVFRPIDEDSVMSADPTPPAMPVTSSRGRSVVMRAPPPVVDDDAMSDASSDLFDLESFAAGSSYPTTSYRGARGGRSRRNSDDDDGHLPYYVAAEPALSECGGGMYYAPSEASVVWSVATAEGGGAFDAANFSSAASACGGIMEEFRFAVPESTAEFTDAMSRGAAGGRKKGGGGGGFLNSCRCEKAVSVGPTPVRMVKPPAYPTAVGKKGSASVARCHSGRVHVPVRT